MSTQQRLIDEFLEAVDRWAEKAETEPWNALFYAVVFTGMGWFVEPRDRVEKPFSPEHRGKTVGEVSRHYSKDQLRDFLLYLTEDQKMWGDFLVIGLVHGIRHELEEWVVGFDDARRNIEASMAEILNYANNPDEHAEFVGVFADKLGVSQPEAIEKLRHQAEWLRENMRKGPEDLVQKKRMLSAWDEVVMPLVSHERIQTWRKEFLDEMTAQR